MNNKAKVLIVDDEAPIRDVLQASLMDEGYDVSTASNGDDALSKLRSGAPQIVLLDIWMPGNKDGIEVLKLAKPDCPETQFVVMSGHGNIETAVRAVKLGAWDFVEKPLSIEKILIIMANIITFQNERHEKQSLLNRLRKNIAIIGDSSEAIKLKQVVTRVAPQTSALLLCGEKGTGRELVAQNIHYLGRRAGKPFIEMTAASVPEDLVAAELFGFEKGVLGKAAKRGKLELASGGTFFLDEICDLSLENQERLLRTIKTRKLQRLGATEALPMDTRIIIATAQNLSERVKQGSVNDELWQLMSTELVSLPSLRERKADIPALILHFGEIFAREGGIKVKVFSDEALSMMQGYSWPGNVRELKNFIERIYILTPTDGVNVHDLKFAGLTHFDDQETGSGVSNFKLARAQFEKEYILKKLAENGGNVSKTAEVIGLERSHLHRKIKSYGIDANEMV